MTDREKLITAIERAREQSEEFGIGFIVVKFKETDLILKLLKEQQPQWISVEDRMPDKQPDEYLVVNAHSVETAICLDNRWITPRRVIKITHWMPLPEPPEVKQDE